jgi:hypothetical protein
MLQRALEHSTAGHSELIFFLAMTSPSSIRIFAILTELGQASIRLIEAALSYVGSILVKGGVALLEFLLIPLCFNEIPSSYFAFLAV